MIKLFAIYQIGCSTVPTVLKFTIELTININFRRIFDKITAETRRVKGTIDGNTDVIRALKTIENKDDFFGKLKNMNKSFNKNKVRISLASDGKVLINNQHTANINKMYRMGPAGRNELLARYGSANVTTKNAPVRIYSSDQIAGSSKVPAKDWVLCNIRPEEIIKISAFLVQLSVADQDFILELLSTLSQIVHDAFLLICTELIILFIPSELKFLNDFGPDWKRRLVFFVIQDLKSRIVDDEKDSLFMATLKTYIRDGRINKETLLKLKNRVMEYFKNLRIDRHAHNKTWDDGDEYMREYLRGFKTLRVGQELAIGSHTILVKHTTVDNFEKWLVNYSQEKCDIFMVLCFKIIETLSKHEVQRLNAINPDEDILMRVSIYLLDRFDDYITVTPIVDECMVISLKAEIIKWCDRQRVRQQYTCVKCKGITYCPNK